MSQESYPEHEKMRAMRERSQACGEFLEWLSAQGLVLARYHEHVNACYEDDVFDPPRQIRMRKICGFTEGVPFAASYQVEKLLAEFFHIDLAKLEDEKRAMLEDLRTRGSEKPAP